MGTKGLAKPVHRAVPVARDVALRVGRVVYNLGEKEALRRLGVGKPTLEAAREYGSMLPSTYARLLEALKRCEAEEAARLCETGT